MRRSAFEEIGKFDENIFMYREEEDVYRRLVASYGNDTITFFREKKIVHLEGGTSEGNQEGIIRAFARSLDSHIYYSQKHGLSAYDVFKTRKRYYAFKSFCLTVLGKKAKASLEKKKSQILKDYCKKVKD
jgi:GT2 family glycosyltransferase